MNKPRKILVSREQAMAWRADPSLRFEEKMDGCFATREVAGCLIAGEQMRDGRFIAFDCLSFSGHDIAARPLRERLGVLNRLPVLRPRTGDGWQFAEQVLAAGGEGIVCKDMSAPYGDMLAFKRTIELLCVVSGFKDGSQSVTIEDAQTGQDRGAIALFGGKCDQVRTGSIIKVIGFGLTARGMIREPRLCQDSPDSWLKQF